MSVHWKLDCAAGTITKCRWYVKTEKLRWLRQMQTSIVPHKSGKISLNRKELKQGLRKIFSLVMPDLIWYIDILVCFLIHHSIPLLFIIVSLWNDISHFIATRPDFPFGKKSLFFCMSNCEELLGGYSRELMGCRWSWRINEFKRLKWVTYSEEWSGTNWLETEFLYTILYIISITLVTF